MTLFVIICGALLLVGALFYLLPTRDAEDDAARLAQANLGWFRLRQAEIELQGEDLLQEDIRLRLLEDESASPGGAASQAGGTFPNWILLPLIAVVSASLYYLLGAAQDVQITQRLQTFDAQSSPEQIQQLMSDIESRSSQRPDNLHYIALLGRFYMGREDYSQALAVYERLLNAAPEDGQALAFAAQAEYLAAGRKLTDKARLRAEQALAADPHQRTALSLLGMASYEQRQFRAAIAYWQRLLAIEPPGSDGARMISSVIATAQQNLDTGEVAAQPGPAQPVAGNAGQGQGESIGVSVRVQLPAGVALTAADTVFVLARNANSGSRMPIAVQRLTGDQLPVTLRLDDSVSMAGQKVSQAESVIVAVQVSADGRPGEASAQWLGQLGPVQPSAAQTPVVITLAPNPGA